MPYTDAQIDTLINNEKAQRVAGDNSLQQQITTLNNMIQTVNQRGTRLVNQLQGNQVLSEWTAP